LINYFATAGHSYTIRSFLEHWAPDLAPRFNIFAYEKLALSLSKGGQLRVPAGAYIFSDLERLSTEQLGLADSLATAVCRMGCRVLNHPLSSLRRFELLKTLYERGINDFNVYRIDERPQRFPVFIRAANDHDGSRTDLLYSYPAVQAQLAELCREGLGDKEWMIIEYLDTADENRLFRKFGSMLFGDIFVPEEILFQRRWMVKNGEPITDLAQDLLQEEEEEFVRARPNVHEDAVRRIFDIANIEYGRIDYGMDNGKIQVWEINTNPMLAHAPYELVPEQLALMVHAAKGMREAFLAIDDVHTHRLDPGPIFGATVLSQSSHGSAKTLPT
jgi:hypothetical protein